MSIFTALLLLVPLVFFAALAVVASGPSRRNTRISRIVVLLAGLPMMAFCCYGFLASFEGNAGQFIWARVIYIGLFVAVAVSMTFAWWPRTRSLS